MNEAALFCEVVHLVYKHWLITALLILCTGVAVAIARAGYRFK
jgi:hypothetical protein